MDALSQECSGRFVCRICGAGGLELDKPGNVGRPLAAEDFRITNSDYGMTADIYRCGDCGFLQCPGLGETLGFYERLEDPRYEEDRRARGIQARKVLERIERFRWCDGSSTGTGRVPVLRGRLLDVGAGSGILLEQAKAMGYEAEGVEPSRWLCERARQHGLTVHQGVLPHPEAHGPYDVVVVMDVVEHVADPVGLLREARQVAAAGGLVAVVTPDVRSVAARLLGRRWWHYRVAHVGYFHKKTLRLAGEKAGLKLLRVYRPPWYFPLDYIIERVGRYLPRFLRMRGPRFSRRIVLPVNFGDSLLGIFEVAGPAACRPCAGAGPDRAG